VSLAIDVQVTTHQSSAATSITSPPFTTHQANEVLLAFATSDGPTSGITFTTVTGAGLSWTLRTRSNSQPGTAEIWQATAPAVLTNATVTANRPAAELGALTVVSFSGASTAMNGAVVSSGSSGSAPSVSLTTTSAGSWIWGVGNDWDRATARIVGAGQVLNDQFLAPVGDTYWVQSQSAVTPSAGTMVTLNDTTPTTDRWDLAAIEVVPSAPGNSPPPPTAPTNLAASVAGSTEVDLAWTASTSSVGIASYSISRNLSTIGSATSTSYADTGVSPSTTYTYTVTGVDTNGSRSLPSNTVTVSTPAGGLNVTGQWAAPISWPIVSIHAVLTYTGKILTMQGDFTTGGTQYLYDPSSGTNINVPNAASDLFCAGQAVLPDGRVLVIGGTATSGGLGTTNVNAFNPATQGWDVLAHMNHPRWYATGTTLGDGRALATSGYNTGSGDLVTIPEIYAPATNTWTDLTGAVKSIPVYPFMYQLPDGRILHAGGSEVATGTEVLDIGTQTWTTIDSRIIDGASIVNYAPGKFMKAGSAADSGNSGPSSNTAFMLDMNQPNPTWQATAPMQYARSFVNLTALPDGTVLASGGETDKSGFVNGNAVMPAELWNPATGTWTTLASMAVPRLYHSDAILLPDGRVWIGGSGGDPGVTDQKSSQIFSPPYLFNGARPSITSIPSSLQYNTPTFVQTPDASSITRVSLIRTGSDTHSFDQNGRMLPLTFTSAPGGINVQMPLNGNYAPPGYYMLFIVNGQGVPSTGAMINLVASSPDTQPPTAPTNLTATLNGTTQVSLGWGASTDNVGVTGYNVLRNGSKIASIAPTTSYTDNTVASNNTYTYTVTAVDAAGNVSGPSNPATVVTPVNTTPPVITNVAAAAGTASATLTWATDKSTNSQVAYGPTAAYGSVTPLDTALVTSHSEVISGLSPGTTYHYKVSSVDASGNVGTSGDFAFVTPARQTLAIDKQVTTHQSSASSTVKSPAFSTTTGKELLEAFVAADGPNTANGQSVLSVSGGGVTWSLRARANNQPGTAEIWEAIAPALLTNAVVTVTLSGAAMSSLTVVAFVGADTSVQGAVIGKSATTGAPSASLVTSGPNSWVWGVGDDWSNAVSHAVAANQASVDEYLAPVGDTYWVQRLTNATIGIGTSVTINDTSPTADMWNLAIIEVRGT